MTSKVNGSLCFLTTCRFRGNPKQHNSEPTKLHVLHHTDNTDPDLNTRYTSTQINSQASTFNTAENNNDSPSADIFHLSFYPPGQGDTISEDSLHLHHSEDVLHPDSYLSLSPSHLKTVCRQFFYFCSCLQFLCFLELSEAAVGEPDETFSRRYATVTLSVLDFRHFL